MHSVHTYTSFLTSAFPTDPPRLIHMRFDSVVVATRQEVVQVEEEPLTGVGSGSVNSLYIVIRDTSTESVQDEQSSTFWLDCAVYSETE
jgi:hypothetical protein